jgi:aminobutyraldehyde dehydrogenase
MTISPTIASIRRADGALISTSDLPPTGHFIGGTFRASEDADAFDVVNPATEELIARVPNGSAAEVDAAVASAHAAQPFWATLVPKQRSEVLHAIADRLAANADLLVRLEAANTGKPLPVAQEDIDGSIDAFRFMAGAVRATTSMAAGDYVEDHLSVILREPLGVIGVVTPWNYPCSWPPGSSLPSSPRATPWSSNRPSRHR